MENYRDIYKKLIDTINDHEAESVAESDYILDIIHAHYEDIKDWITGGPMSPEMLAFYQGAAWALANLSEDLVDDYTNLAEMIDRKVVQ